MFLVFLLLCEIAARHWLGSDSDWMIHSRLQNKRWRWSRKFEIPSASQVVNHNSFWKLHEVLSTLSPTHSSAHSSNLSPTLSPTYPQSSVTNKVRWIVEQDDQNLIIRCQSEVAYGSSSNERTHQATFGHTYGNCRQAQCSCNTHTHRCRRTSNRWFIRISNSKCTTHRPQAQLSGGCFAVESSASNLRLIGSVISSL